MFIKTVTIFIIGITSVLGQTVSTSVGTYPAEDGSVSFQYFDSDAKDAAEKLEALFISSVNKLTTYVSEVNTSNSALTAYNTYVKVEASAKGTDCYIGGQDENRFEKAPEDIRTALMKCYLFRPLDNREALRKAVVEGLKKIQSYDNNLNLSATLCFSLRVPKSQSCIDSDKKAHEGIKSVVSKEELDKYQALIVKAFTNGKTFIDACLTTATQPLRDQLTSWTKRITDCQASLKS